MFFCNNRRTAVAAYSAFFWSAVFFCALSLLFFSCATPPKKTAFSPLDFFDFFLPYEGAPLNSNDLYAVIPVAENETLLYSLLKDSMPKKSITEMISRTQTLYFALSWKTGRFKVVAQGNFPKAFAPFVFSSSNGWVKQSFSADKTEKSFLSYYEARPASDSLIQAALPVSGLIFMSSGDMETMLERAGSQSPRTTFFEDDVRQIIEETRLPAIRFFVPGSRSLIPQLLGADVTLPVTYAAGFCMPVYEASLLRGYSLDLSLRFADSRFTRPSAVVLRNALKLFPQAVVTVENNSTVRINNLNISLEMITGIL